MNYKFKDHVYVKPYVPYYDEYKGEIFIIKQTHPHDKSGEHVWMECISNTSIKVKGYVHRSDIEQVDNVRD
jgi:hypothetical protein